MSIYIIIGLIFASCFSACFTILYRYSLKNDPVRQRLIKLEGGTDGGGQSALGIDSMIQREAGLKGLSPESVSGMKAWLAMAGYRSPQAAPSFYQYTILGAIVIGALAFGLSFFFHLKISHLVLATMGGVALGGLIPRLWIWRRIALRRDEIRRAVPNFLDLMVVCVEAGLSFTAAIQKLADETRLSCRPLSEELRLATQEILIGKSKADAFRNLANRTGVEELRSLAVTLIQADKLGTSIAHSLRVLADSMRFKRHQRAEEAANKTTVKLVFPLVFLIFPELLVILVGPALIKIIKTLSEVAR